MAYDPNVFVHNDEIKLSSETVELLKQSSQMYNENFDGTTWYGRCIFISWWCSTPTCKFCYRSTIKHQKKHPELAKRSMGSMLIEALFCKVFHWRIEFLTGGCNCVNEEELEEITKNVSLVYGEKIWVNLGVIPQKTRDEIAPYVKGICSSIETPVQKIHDFMCPQKPIAPYVHMFTNSSAFKKSAAFIVGLGDTKEDFQDWVNFIKEQKLDRITVYALKPIKNGPIEEGPSSDFFINWLARLRIAFPKLEIIGGTNLRRSEEVGYMMKAGVNAITKFPATKEFGSKKAQKVTELIKTQGRNFISNLTDMPKIDWNTEIDSLPIQEEYKSQMKKSLVLYFPELKEKVFLTDDEKNDLNTKNTLECSF